MCVCTTKGYSTLRDEIEVCHGVSVGMCSRRGFMQIIFGNNCPQSVLSDSLLHAECITCNYCIFSDTGILHSLKNVFQ